jgi:Tol biopolymer transport system component
MNESTERVLADWLAEGPDRGPTSGLERAMAATRRTTQRPGWTIPERWLPMQLAIRPAFAPRPSLLFLAAAVLAATLAGALFLIGSQRHPAPPFGLAGNGSIVVGIDGHLWLAGADGSGAGRLFLGQTFASSPVYSPDGTRLAFKTRGAERTPWSVYAANPDGSAARSLTGDFPVAAWELDGPSWSPDGTTIAFSSSDHGINRIYLVGTDGRGIVNALTGRDMDRRYPAFSPDGAWIAYRATPLDSAQSTSLMIRRPDGSGERTLVSVPWGDMSFSGAQWAADSRRIAYFRGQGTHVVGMVDLDGHETVISLPGEDAVNPAWSPDGTQLVYSVTDGSFVVDVGDPKRRLAIPGEFSDCGLAWAPDGTALIGIDHACTSLYRIPLDDPAAARRIEIPEGVIDAIAWQRIAP